MKKTNLKKVITLFMMVAMLSTAVFAKDSEGKGKGKGDEGPKDKKEFECRNEQHPQLKADLIGTVVSVDEKSSIIVVKDADGKDVKVRVSPFTHIVKMPLGPEFGEKPADAAMAKGEPKDAPKDAPKDFKKGEDRPGKNRMPPAPVSISDIKAGSWVAIDKFKTQTQVVDAQEILVLEKMEAPSATTPKQ